MNSEDKNKIEEVGLPKSTLCNFIKEILNSQNMKSEKQIFDLMDKITTKYVNYVSNLASQICTEKGKKTLNVDHVIQALKTMNFDSHIKRITSELDLSQIKDEDKGKEIIEDAQEMKDLINQQKKKNKKKKKHIEFTEEMANEQLNLFAKANEMMSSVNPDSLPFPYEDGVDQIPDGNILRVNGNKKMRLDVTEIDIFAHSSVNKNEEVDFD